MYYTCMHFKDKYVTMCKKKKKKEEDETMVILCKRTTEILMCFIVLQYFHCSSIVFFFPNETHSFLTLVLALSCWMQMPKPDKNPQC